MKKRITEEQWEQAKKWKQEGVNGTEIAKRLTCSAGRVSQKLGKRRLDVVEGCKECKDTTETTEP